MGDRLRQFEQRLELILIGALEINRHFDPDRSPVEIAHFIEDELRAIHQLNQARGERGGPCDVPNRDKPLRPIGREKKTMRH